MKRTAIDNLAQLKSLLSNLDSREYTAKNDVLSGSSIGEHIRHILEFYVLLISGAKEGVICYDKRERNVSLETDLAVSISLLNTLIDEVSCIDDTAFIVVKADYSRVGQAEKEIASSVSRELAYCIEHSIHHQALIKAVLIMRGLIHLIQEDFGLAYSTIRYRNESCAQ